MNEQDRRDAAADRALVAILGLVEARAGERVKGFAGREDSLTYLERGGSRSVAELAAKWQRLVQTIDLTLDVTERKALSQQERGARAELDKLWAAVESHGLPAVLAEISSRRGGR